MNDLFYVFYVYYGLIANHQNIFHSRGTRQCVSDKSFKKYGREIWKLLKVIFLLKSFKILGLGRICIYFPIFF